MTNPIEIRRPLWRQPLVHFVVLGALIFVWDGVRGNAPSQDSLNIVVSEPQIDRMAGLWSKTWGRPPTGEELQGLIQNHIKEEIYYREARRLGLDQNDEVIRRRLRQKMEFLSADTVDTQEPSAGILRAYYTENKNKYKSGAVFNIEQIYYKSGQEVRAAQDLIALNAGSNQDKFGDTISLPKRLDEADEAQISRLFGSLFYTQIQTLTEDAWTGPLTSGFGLHVVRVKKLKASGYLSFETVKDKVEMDWRAASKLKRRDGAFAKLSAPYTINVQSGDIQRPND